MITEIIIFLWGRTGLLEKSWNSKINCQNLTGQICLEDLMETVKLESKKGQDEWEKEQEKHEEKPQLVDDISPMWLDGVSGVTFACLQWWWKHSCQQLQFSHSIGDFSLNCYNNKEHTFCSSSCPKKKIQFTLLCYPWHSLPANSSTDTDKWVNHFWEHWRRY